MKNFIITIDTEGDNLWSWKSGDCITTENSKYLYRFQELCNKYSFKPVWLANWEMINDENFINYFKNQEKMGKCEIGMHIHAWNNPPFYKLDIAYPFNAPYLIEYPENIIEEKIDTYLEEFRKKFNHMPMSHRAGRWTMNEFYYKLLKSKGIKIDCSITPGLSWESSIGQSINSKGTDYTNAESIPHFIDGVYEVPVTLRKRHYFSMKNIHNFRNLLGEIKRFSKGRMIWLRPDGNNYDEMKWIVDKNISDDKVDYLMFVLHSSELMPGGSPVFDTREQIEKLYIDLTKIFDYMSKFYFGTTLFEYFLKNKKKV